MSDGNEFQRGDRATENIRQLLAGMVARAVGTVGVTMLTEVSDIWAGRRHKPADSSMVARDHVAPETPESHLEVNTLW